MTRESLAVWTQTVFVGVGCCAVRRILVTTITVQRNNCEMLQLVFVGRLLMMLLGGEVWTWFAAAVTASLTLALAIPHSEASSVKFYHKGLVKRGNRVMALPRLNLTTSG
jgi:hypothetical protein